MAVMLMITGIGLIGTITANLASHWIAFFKGENAQEADHSERNQVERELRKQAHGWIDRIDELNDKEYDTLLETLDLLRKRKS